MSRTPDPDALDRFLAAERDDRTEESEDALLALFEALPELAPSAGFADRALLRAGIGMAAPARSRTWRPALVVLGLAAAAWIVAWAPVVFLALGHLASPFGLISAANAGLASFLSGAGELVQLGQKLLVLGEILTRPLRTPAVAGLASAGLGVSWIAFRSLRDLLSRQRSWAHVEPK
jgi:hypothetical protein